MTDLVAIANSWAFTSLSAAITDSAVSMVAKGGEGSRFDAIAADEHYYLSIIDLNETSNPYGAFEIVKATAKSTDTWTIVRAQGGTTAKQFPITGGNDVSKVMIVMGDNVDQIRELIGSHLTLYARTNRPATPAADTGVLYSIANDSLLTLLGGADTSIDQFVIDEQGLVMRPGSGYGVVSDADHDWSGVAAPEIPRTVVMTPTATRTITFPTLKVPIGWDIELHNFSTGFDMTLKPSDGATSYTLGPGEWVRIKAVAKIPTTGAEWRKVAGDQRREVYVADDTFTVPAFVSRVNALVTGGGGGGSGSSDGSSNPGGGGGAGGTSIGHLAVTAGDADAVTVGAAGSAGGNNSAGGTGGTSTFKGISSVGGTGGGVTQRPKGGVGGTSSGGDMNIIGGDGETCDVGASAVAAAGGGGGSSYWGGGGRGGYNINGPETGKANGSGGGGGFEGLGSGDEVGAAGKVGIMIIEY